MMEASVRGAIDLSAADLDDGRWWGRLHHVCNVLQRQKDQTLSEAKMQFHLAQISVSGMTQETYRKIGDAAADAYDDLHGVLRPWAGQNAKERKQREFKGYRQAYADAFGVDPLDPRFKEWEAEQIRRFREERAAKK